MAACRSSQLAVYLLVITIMSVVCNVFASSSVSVFELTNTNWQMLRLRACYATQPQTFVRGGWLVHYLLNNSI